MIRIPKDCDDMKRLGAIIERYKNIDTVIHGEEVMERLSSEIIEGAKALVNKYGAEQ